MTDEDDLVCEDEHCGRLVECFVCERCAEHCALKDPEFCWEAHESWRLGKGDPAFVDVLASVPTMGKPVTIDGKRVPLARKPRRLHKP